MSTDNLDDLDRMVELLLGPDPEIATGPIANLTRLYVICHHQMEAGDLDQALRTLRAIARMERELQLDLKLAGAPGNRRSRTVH